MLHKTWLRVINKFQKPRIFKGDLPEACLEDFVYVPIDASPESTNSVLLVLASANSMLSLVDADNYRLEKCSWDVENAQVYLKAEDSLFPEQNCWREALRAIFVSVCLDEIATTLCIGDLSVRKMNQLLSCIYSPDASNVELTLYLAEEFMFKGPKMKCETFLISSKTLKPIQEFTLALEHDISEQYNKFLRRASTMQAYGEDPHSKPLNTKQMEQFNVNISIPDVSKSNAGESSKNSKDEDLDRIYTHVSIIRHSENKKNRTVEQ